MKSNNDTHHDEMRNPKSEKGGEKSSMGFEQKEKKTSSDDNPTPGNGRPKRTQEDEY